ELVVLAEELGALDLLAGDVTRLARVRDLHAPEHLPNDHLDVLVVDLHALQTVDVLYLVDDVAGELFHAEQPQDVLRVGRTVDDGFALVHDLSFGDDDVLLLRDELFVDLAFRIGDLQAHLALGLLAERDGAGHLGERALVLGRARLEQLGDPRQAAGDVAGLLPFDRDARHHLAGSEVLAVADLDQRANREGDRHRVVGAGDLHLVAVAVEELDLRTDDLGRAASLRVDDDQRRQARDLVDLLGDGDAFLDVLELRAAGELGDDRARQRVPAREHGAGLDLLVGLDAEQRPVRHLVALALAAVRIHDHDLARARDDDQLALAVGDVAHRRVEAHRAFRLRLDARCDRRTRRSTADVEGAHRELRAGLADRLRRDHADRFADVDEAAAAEFAAVALGADAEACRARQRGA